MLEDSPAKIPNILGFFFLPSNVRIIPSRNVRCLSVLGELALAASSATSGC